MMTIDTPCPLYKGLDNTLQVWMSHGDKVVALPEGYESVAHSDNCPYATMQHKEKPIYGVQFHPEVVHTPNGSQMLKNFAFDICGCQGDWQMSQFVEHTVASIREEVGEEHVLLGLSGGVIPR